MTIPIVEYDKKGKIVKTFNQMLNDNITLPIIANNNIKIVIGGINGEL